MLVHRERRMAIRIAAYAASSTKGANHDIINITNPSQWQVHNMKIAIINENARNGYGILVEL